jgi:hypothetical protein
MLVTISTTITGKSNMNRIDFAGKGTLKKENGDVFTGDWIKYSEPLFFFV